MPGRSLDLVKDGFHIVAVWSQRVILALFAPIYHCVAFFDATFCLIPLIVGILPFASTLLCTLLI